MNKGLLQNNSISMLHEINHSFSEDTPTFKCNVDKNTEVTEGKCPNQPEVFEVWLFMSTSCTCVDSWIASKG